MNVFGVEDVPIRRALSQEPIQTVERGRGGRSLGFKVTLKDGTQGYFKPEQTFSAAHWYSEVASYHLDRELGFGRVAPVISRRIPWSDLKRASGSDERVEELVIDENGFLRGAFIWWIPHDLVPLPLGRGWERWIRIEPWSGQRISPMTRPRVYRDTLEMAHAGYELPQNPDERLAGQPSRPELPQELSDLLVFDYLIHNVDRWGGDNTNVRTFGRKGSLVFFDNAAGFPPVQQIGGIMESRLKVLQRFSRRTIDAVAKFDMARYRTRLAEEPLAPILTEEQLLGLDTRRKALLAYVAKLEARFGEKIYTWP
ncbi:MAG: hypothetical protein H6715_00495 [Myxococcales bacterium]|nr:hypothetical protein [Myxococcales bacterium]MCB9707444.1 hypothetical protein [Myxococcales bacterium]